LPSAHSLMLTRAHSEKAASRSPSAVARRMTRAAAAATIPLVSLAVAVLVVAGLAAKPLSTAARMRLALHDHMWWWPAQRKGSSRGGSGLSTLRVGCREYEAGAQSCVFEGIACVSVNGESVPTIPGLNALSTVFLVDDELPDGTVVPSDDWCSFRHQSADPRYFGPRHWPIRNDTVAPQWSCMNARYRTFESLLGSKVSTGATFAENAPQVMWLPSLWLVNLDYPANTHNNHLLKDIVWMLDVSLWHRSLQLRQSPLSEGIVTSVTELFSDKSRHIFLPQSLTEFQVQTSKDVNRLLYALVLELDVHRLYPNMSSKDLRSPQSKNTSLRRTVPLLTAYPELGANSRLLFREDLVQNKSVDLVCTPRLTVGAKLADVGHERVCRNLRERAWELFGIEPPSMVRVGQIYYPRPPRRILVVQRHISRGFGNLNQLLNTLRTELGTPYGVEVEVMSTADLQTAEQYVRTFSRAGVVITPHGSQSMGQIWMPRHR
jgi:hypothetical protein